MSLSVPYQLKLGVHGVTDTRKVDTSCVYNQADRYNVSV